MAAPLAPLCITQMCRRGTTDRHDLCTFKFLSESDVIYGQPHISFKLELRIMAHMSGDRQLCHLLSRNDRDVFKSIAATWKRKLIDDVTEKERNEAKQICYGMLYGIGVKGKLP